MGDQHVDLPKSGQSTKLVGCPQLTVFQPVDCHASGRRAHFFQPVDRHAWVFSVIGRGRATVGGAVNNVDHNCDGDLNGEKAAKKEGGRGERILYIYNYPVFSLWRGVKNWLPPILSVPYFTLPLYTDMCPHDPFLCIVAIYSKK